MTAPQGTIDVRRGLLRWRFLLRASNGKVMAQSSGPRTYTRKANAVRAARRVAQTQWHVRIVEDKPASPGQGRTP